MELQLARLVAALAYINRAVTHAAYGDTAACVLAKIADEVARYKALVVGGEKASRRGLLQMISKKDAANSKWFEYMRIPGTHNLHPFLSDNFLLNPIISHITISLDKNHLIFEKGCFISCEMVTCNAFL
jgi:hypothetical protein